MKDRDAKKKRWLQHRLQASGGFTGLPNRLVDSKAFAALTTGASVKTIIWFWQAVEYAKKGKRKPGAEPIIGRVDKIVNNGELSFTYQEAEWRGIKQVRFSRALKELHRLGFIDISRQGHGAKGEYTKYAISTRWQTYGTSNWLEIPYPKSYREGFTSDEYIEKRRKESKKNSVQKRTLPTFKNERYEVDESSRNVQKRTLETPLSGKSQRPKTNVSLDLPCLPVGPMKGAGTWAEDSEERKEKIATTRKSKKRRNNDSDISFEREVETLVRSYGGELVPFFGSEAVH